MSAPGIHIDKCAHKSSRSPPQYTSERRIAQFSKKQIDTIVGCKTAYEHFRMLSSSFSAKRLSPLPSRFASNSRKNAPGIRVAQPVAHENPRCSRHPARWSCVGLNTCGGANGAAHAIDTAASNRVRKCRFAGLGTTRRRISRPPGGLHGRRFRGDRRRLLVEPLPPDREVLDHSVAGRSGAGTGRARRRPQRDYHWRSLPRRVRHTAGARRHRTI